MAAWPPAHNGPCVVRCLTHWNQLNVHSRNRGADLEGCQYRHPLFDRVSPVVVGGDYITTESGTGLVHTAPGHGQEDYQAGGEGPRLWVLLEGCLLRSCNSCTCRCS